jgi:hypothetical protein
MTNKEIVDELKRRYRMLAKEKHGSYHAVDYALMKLVAAEMGVV